MDASKTLPVIAGVEIALDSEGRYNLNALHKASGEGQHKAPAQWMRTKQAQEFIQEIIDVQICTSPVSASKGGADQGTFAHELIAVEYAGWISPSFRIKVNQTFIDCRTGKLQPALNPATLSRLDILQMAIQSEERAIALEQRVAVIQPKAEALDLIATGSDGSLNITETAKTLQINPKMLFQWLSGHRWIYRRAGGSGWVAYQDKLQQGLLEHKVTTVHREDGSEKITEQVRVTAKGLARLAEAFGSNKGDAA